MTPRSQSVLRTGASVVALAALTACGDGDDAPAPAQAPFAAAVDCTTLASARWPDTEIESAEQIPAGTFQPPGSATAFTHLPSFCRVVAVTHPVPDSRIRMEIWLPTTTWNGKYEQVGTHSWGGTIYWNKMVLPLRRGYATAATDDGHTAPGIGFAGGFDVSWAFGHPEKVVDTAWRGVHETAVKAKQLIAQYYGRPHRQAYYLGCSSGGRNGMKSAQVHPDDFDGIVAGGAAQNWTGTALQMLLYTQRAKATGITNDPNTSALALLQKATVAACDGLDGLTDGIITDPRQCTFSPRSLVCTAGQDPATCITGAQADALVANAQTLSYTNGQVVAEGLMPGSEFDQLRFNLPAQDVYPYANISLGLNDPTWDRSTFDLDTDGPRVASTLQVMNALDPHLSAFKAAGGKLIQYHGWGDAAFPPTQITRYYDSVVAETGNGNLSSVQDFYRLFMVPGAGHCLNAGPGPDNIGGDNQTPVALDADHDLLTALEDWVEKGIRPERLIATQLNDRSNTDPNTGIVRQRPLCAYPAVAVYNGTGAPQDASSFRCQAPAR